MRIAVAAVLGMLIGLPAAAGGSCVVAGVAGHKGSESWDEPAKKEMASKVLMKGWMDDMVIARGKRTGQTNEAKTRMTHEKFYGPTLTLKQTEAETGFGFVIETKGNKLQVWQHLKSVHATAEGNVHGMWGKRLKFLNGGRQFRGAAQEKAVALGHFYRYVDATSQGLGRTKQGVTRIALELTRTGVGRGNLGKVLGKLQTNVDFSLRDTKRALSWSRQQMDIWANAFDAEDKNRRLREVHRRLGRQDG